MTKRFKQNIRNILDATEEEIVSTVAECRREYRALTNSDCVELGDRAANSKYLDELGSVMEHYERRLARTRSAKNRLENGHFGLCVECGKRIAENRLLARPDTLFCYDCANKRERRSRYRVVAAL
ncbi:MAG: TraR/DksA family transcriptional regulator [Alkalispirochaetaceae bacterium]